MAKAFILDLGLFEPQCGSVDWSELILADLLRLLCYANRRALDCGKIPPLYQSGVRYKTDAMSPFWKRLSLNGDLVDKEIFMAIPAILRDGGADCFPEGTLLLKEGMQLVPIESIEEGDRVWGLDSFVDVEAKAFKGDLTVDAIRLNNGSTVCLTPDHHVYVLICPTHNQESNHGYGCACLPEKRAMERIRVSELRPGMVMPQPKRLPFGEEEYDPDRAYVEGLFIAEGWSSKNASFEISGLDGWRKEKQKHEVKAICDRLGIRTHWARKYISVKDPEWTLRMKQMGPRARFKHALSLNLAEAPAANLLRGIMADANVKNASTGRTFTTTSKELCTQVRVLHRMFARSASYMYTEKHGGLGKHPIYRLGIREPLHKPEKLLRVKSIDRKISKAPCWDIQTSDNRVYLPEHDVTVSQCEDLSAWRVAELRNAGEGTNPVQVDAREQFVIKKFRLKDGSLMYHIQVQRLVWDGQGWQKGPIEDPSRILGMGDKQDQEARKNLNGKSSIGRMRAGAKAAIDLRRIGWDGSAGPGPKGRYSR